MGIRERLRRNRSENGNHRGARPIVYLGIGAIGLVLGGVGVHEYDDEGGTFLPFDGTKAKCEASNNLNNARSLGTHALSHEQIADWQLLKRSPLIDGTPPDSKLTSESQSNENGYQDILDAIEGNETRWVLVTGEVDAHDASNVDQIAADAIAAGKLISGWNTNPNVEILYPQGNPVDAIDPAQVVQVTVLQPRCES